MSAVNDHLVKARNAIVRGDEYMKDAAEHIAAAIKLGCSQREAAAKVDKSAAWVNRLLKWRTSGYTETAFGPENKAKRTRERVQSAEQKKEKSEARARADQAKAEAATAKARARQAKADASAARARAKAERERTKQEQARDFRRAFSGDEGGGSEKLDDVSRARLVKFLGMLGSNSDGERANAAKMADDLRKKLGLSWDELIVKAAAMAEAA